MDQFKKRILEEFANMERHMGRMIRNTSFPGMVNMQASNMLLAADVYETAEEIIVCMDVSGIDPEEMSIVADRTSVTVSGERQLPALENLSCVHQLELERGRFERTLPLPVPVDVSATTSVCKNGFAIIRMPKLSGKGKVQIKVS